MLSCDFSVQTCGNTSVHVYSKVCGKTLSCSVLLSKFVCSCSGYCAKSNKNRVGMVPHETPSGTHYSS
jgi:hypothetical protein